MTKELAKIIGEKVDKWILTPLAGHVREGRPVVWDLYQAARELLRDPLTYLAAAKLVENVREGDNVIVSHGFLCAPWMVQETDGPVGAAGLARAVSLGLGATPVIVSEPQNDGISKATCLAAGLQPCDSLELASLAPRKAVVEPFPLEKTKAEKAAVDLLDRINPSAVIAIEKAGANVKGVYHMGAGVDVSALVSKIDYLIEEAKRRGILTIGIGDGGNEIGMGLVLKKANEVLGTNCGCPCGSGVASATSTDVLVVCGTSNWGGYGIEACLGALLDRPEVLHSPETEKFMLEECVRAGANNPISGLSEPWVDGVPGKVSIDVVDILGSLLGISIASPLYWGMDQLKRETRIENRPKLLEKTLRWGKHFSKAFE